MLRFAKSKLQMQYPEHFLTFCAGSILIASGVRALAWLKKERKKENKLAFAVLLSWCCWRAMLAIWLAKAVLEKDRKAFQSV